MSERDHRSTMRPFVESDLVEKRMKLHPTNGSSIRVSGRILTFCETSWSNVKKRLGRNRKSILHERREVI